jgi:hypothetical protein
LREARVAELDLGNDPLAEVMAAKLAAQIFGF